MAQKAQKYRYPVVYYESNLIFANGKKDVSNISGKECWVCYRWLGFNYDFLKKAEKIARLLKNARAFQQVFLEAQILSIPLKSKISDSMNYLRSIASGEMKAIGLQYIDNTEYVLSENDTKENDYETFLVIKLKKPRALKDYKDLLVSLTREPYRAVNEFLSLDIAEIYSNEIDAWKRLEQSLRNSIRKYINIKETNEVDIEKLIKIPFWRGLNMPKLRGKEAYYNPVLRKFEKAQPWKPTYRKLKIGNETVIRPLKRDILSLCEGKVDGYPKHVEIKHFDRGEELTSYQQFVVVSSLPDIRFPTEREWIYNLKDLEFPVWTSIRFVKKDYEEVSKAIGDKRKELTDQIDHIKEAPGDVKVPQKYLDQDEAIESAKYVVEKEKKPFLYTTVVIAVAADNLTDCHERTKAVQDYFDDMDIETQVPVGDQWDLFNEMLIGSRQYASADYIQRLPPETLAGCMIGASNMIGDPLGLYIATTGMLEKAVKFDPFRASQINESPAISITGTLGRGKSLLANLIAVLTAFMGGRVLINDPKKERGNWGEHLPAIVPYLNIIELSAARANRGKLDIFLIMLKSLGKDATRQEKRDIAKQAAEYELSILGTLAGYKTTDERMEYLADAVNAVSQEDNPCGMKIIEKLGKLAQSAQVQEDKVIYKRLQSTLINRINNTTYGHLLFGDGSEEVIDITKPINILQTQNLIIPDKGKPEENWTYQERVGMAVLICTSAVGLQFVMQSREFLKMYIQDENSVFKRAAMGQAMQNRMIKMGRTENSPIVLIGQNQSDIGESEDIMANIGIRFAFGTKTRGEAMEILKYMGLNQESKELQDMLIALPTGVCLMRDLEGRIALIAVDPIFEDFLKAFDTKPVLRIDNDDEKAMSVDTKPEAEVEEKTEDKDQIEIINEDQAAAEEEDEEKSDEEINEFLKSWGKREDEKD